MRHGRDPVLLERPLQPLVVKLLPVLVAEHPGAPTAGQPPRRLDDLHRPSAQRHPVVGPDVLL